MIYVGVINDHVTFNNLLNMIQVTRIAVANKTQLLHSPKAQELQLLSSIIGNKKLHLVSLAVIGGVGIKAKK